jgi:hypothetical protein
MESQREQELVRLLDEYDVKGVQFLQAKKELLAKGYTEAELVYGLYSAPFDGKANNTNMQPVNPLQELYTQHPEQAEKIAKILLADQAEREWDKTITNTAAAELGPDIQTRSHYSVRAADRLGIPYFSLMAVGLVLLLVSIKFDLSKHSSNILFSVYGVGINLIFGLKLLQERIRINKLRK